MDPLGAYLPADRLRALARGQSLPEKTRGSALFADLSGSTPLAEALTRVLGARRGAEEVTRQLNLVYDVLIAEVDTHGGSVIGFAGDAITCWFDGDDGSQATMAALGMQTRMRNFSSIEVAGIGKMGLALKASVASGPARRMVVGDPALQLIDVVGGDVVVRMATGEHLAGKGELVVDGETVRRLGDRLKVAEWREDHDSGGRYAVVSAMDTETTLVVRHGRSAMPVAAETLRPWLLPAVYDRLRAGKGEFLTELRPAVALFTRFEGIDYERDEESAPKLDAFIRRVSRCLAEYDAAIVQLTIGDKGSFFYVGFGAPTAHENDNERSLMAALALRELPGELGFLQPLHIGISRGTMRIGAYGGTTRRTYGILGDEVNLAARLMQQAAPGQILASSPVYQAGLKGFVWERLPDVRVKGKANPVMIFSLGARDEGRRIRLHEPKYSLPMVGREQELGVIRDRLDQTVGGRPQAVGITAEAGLGKSRLVAEAIGMAERQGMAVFGGECQSHGQHTSYLVWRGVLLGLLEIDPSAAVERQVEQAGLALRGVSPALAPRLPLLGPVLNLPIADTELTRSLDAKLRRSALESLVVEFLGGMARRRPLLLVFEDCHWIDPLSAELIELVVRGINGLPLMMLASYRPSDLAGFPAPGLAGHPRFTRIVLSEFSAVEAERLIALKLRRLVGEEGETPRALVERLTARTGGNPFYIEELLNYLQDQGVNPRDPAAWENLELPQSLHSLILSRMDRLTENQRAAVKVAAVIGRVFQASMLWGVYPQLGDPAEVMADLEELARLEVTTLEQPQPELAYLFKHVVTQQVAYDSLAFETRSTLHEQIGLYLETRHAGTVARLVDLLAFHFDRTRNTEKRRQYLLQAAAAAQQAYAHAVALDYYGRALPLLEGRERVPVLLSLGQIHELLGHWSEAAKLYADALELARQLADAVAEAECDTATGDLLQKQGRFGEATEWLDRAGVLFRQAGDRAGLARTLNVIGTIAAKQGDYPRATACFSEALSIRRELDDQPRVASLFSNLGIVRRFEGDYAGARELYEEGLRLRRQLGDRGGIANSLNNLGLLLQQMGDPSAARAMLEESLTINREIGDRWSIANCLNSLSSLTLQQGDFDATRASLQESLRITQDLGDLRSIAFLLESSAQLAVAEGMLARGLSLAGAAARLRETIGAPLSKTDQAQLDRSMEPCRAGLGSVEAEKAYEAGRAMPAQEAVRFALQPG